jgi:hypothetical protein
VQLLACDLLGGLLYVFPSYVCVCLCVCDCRLSTADHVLVEHNGASCCCYCHTSYCDSSCSSCCYKQAFQYDMLYTVQHSFCCSRCWCAQRAQQQRPTRTRCVPTASSKQLWVRMHTVHAPVHSTRISHYYYTLCCTHRPAVAIAAPYATAMTSLRQLLQQQQRLQVRYSVARPRALSSDSDGGLSSGATPWCALLLLLLLPPLSSCTRSMTWRRLPEATNHSVKRPRTASSSSRCCLGVSSEPCTACFSVASYSSGSSRCMLLMLA